MWMVPFLVGVSTVIALGLMWLRWFEREDAS